MIEWLFFLLPIAALSGWLTARNYYKKKLKPNNKVGPAYFEGLNYLLNEQPDKAIDVFIRLLEVNSDTVETHLALANLFRRRGETDRALRIHQNLIARPTLTLNQRTQALTELGLDYMHAGVLDRAESIFLELQQQSTPPKEADRQLLRIYQQQKNWPQAIQVAKQLNTPSQSDIDTLIAQFYCELATIEKNTAPSAANKYLKQALHYDPKCVRALLLEAEIAIAKNQYQSAINTLNLVAIRNADYIAESLPQLHQCYQQLGKLNDLKQWLSDFLSTHNANTSAKLLLADVIKQTDGIEAANTYLCSELDTNSNLLVLNKLLSFEHNQTRNLLPKLSAITHALVMQSPIYSCQNCGFAGKTMHWQCPSCSKWQTIRPNEPNLIVNTGADK